MFPSIGLFIFMMLENEVSYEKEKKNIKRVVEKRVNKEKYN